MPHDGGGRTSGMSNQDTSTSIGEIVRAAADDQILLGERPIPELVLFSLPH